MICGKAHSRVLLQGYHDDTHNKVSQIARFMWPTWGPPGFCRPQVGLILAPWTLLSGILHSTCTVTPGYRFRAYSILTTRDNLQLWLRMQFKISLFSLIPPVPCPTLTHQRHFWFIGFRTFHIRRSCIWKLRLWRPECKPIYSTQYNRFCVCFC